MAVMTWDYARTLMQTGAGSVRKLDSNTFLHAYGHGDYAIQLHATDIIVIHRDGTFQLYTGGYNTKITRTRIQEFSPASLTQVNGKLHVVNILSAEVHGDPIRELSDILTSEGTVPLRWAVKWHSVQLAWNKSKDVLAMLYIAKAFGKKPRIAASMIKSIGVGVTPDDVREKVQPPTLEDIEDKTRVGAHGYSAPDTIHVYTQFFEGITVNLSGVPL